jgi:hypothetical protein
LSGGSDESKEHGDARNAKESETNDGDDVEGSEVIQLVVHRGVYRLAHIAAQSKGTQVPTEAVNAGPQGWCRLAGVSEYLGSIAAAQPKAHGGMTK